jgi:hypothetical protein
MAEWPETSPSVSSHTTARTLTLRQAGPALVAYQPLPVRSTSPAHRSRPHPLDMPSRNTAATSLAYPFQIYAARHVNPRLPVRQPSASKEAPRQATPATPHPDRQSSSTTGSTTSADSPCPTLPDPRMRLANPSASHPCPPDVPHPRDSTTLPGSLDTPVLANRHLRPPTSHTTILLSSPDKSDRTRPCPPTPVDAPALSRPPDTAITPQPARLTCQTPTVRASETDQRVPSPPTDLCHPPNPTNLSLACSTQPCRHLWPSQLIRLPFPSRLQPPDGPVHRPPP